MFWQRNSWFIMLFFFNNKKYEMPGHWTPPNLEIPSSRFGFRANNGTEGRCWAEQTINKKKTLNNYTSEPKHKIEV